jgi:hypothetical protein
MSCEIIQFSVAARPARHVSAKQAAAKAEEGADEMTNYRSERAAKRAAKLLEVTTAPENFSETCRNQRFRLSRRDAWWAADRLTDYWRARLDWQSALSVAQSNNVADANCLVPAFDGSDLV